MENRSKISERCWILGAEDPEMTRIEKILVECGEWVEYAMADGQRVHPGNAYRSHCPALEEWHGLIYLVECGLAGPRWPMEREDQSDGAGLTEVIDHQQVVSLLAKDGLLPPE